MRHSGAWALAIAASACLPVSRAAEPDFGRLSGRIWSVGRDWRTVGATGETVGFRPLDEYLSVGWADVGVRGLNLDLLVRGRGDVRLEGSDDDEIDLLNARVVWKGALRGVDLAFGRQYLIWGNGYYNFDGVRLDWRPRGRWGALAFAGAPLGFQEHNRPASGGRTLGAGVSYERPLVERYALMVERQALSGDILRQRLAVDLRRTLGRRWEGYASADYNDGIGRWGDLLAGTRARFGRRLRLGAEWMRYLPDFPLDSIFNVFPVEPFTEARAEAGWEGRAGSGVWVRAGEQRFEHSSALRRSRPFVEVTLRPPRSKGRHLEATLFHASGYGGDRRGIRVSGGTSLWWPGWSIRGGADLHDFRNPYRLVEREKAVSAWGRVEWQSARRWNAWLEGRQQWSVLDRREFEAAAGAGLRFGGPG
jgi:hypothetical protein